LARYLTEVVASQPERTENTRYGTPISSRDVRMDANDASHILAQLDTLSDEDVDVLLADLAAA
jgi:hypothetical protein